MICRVIKLGTLAEKILMELRAFTYLLHRYRHLSLKRLGHTSIKQIAELNWIFLTQKSKF
jgi:hypothetical protein